MVNRPNYAVVKDEKFANEAMQVAEKKINQKKKKNKWRNQNQYTVQER